MVIKNAGYLFKKVSYHSQYTDELLLSHLKAGDESAFTEIYNRYWKKLYALAYSRTKSKPAAEDVVHEVFTSLWQRRYQADIQTLYPYLSAAAKYAILNQMIKYKNQKLFENSMRSDAHSVYDQSIDHHFLQQMISSEINKLPEKCKLVFQYSRYSELSNKEIAGKLHITEKAVEKHITKAISRLRVQLKHFFFITLYLF